MHLVSALNHRERRGRRGQQQQKGSPQRLSATDSVGIDCNGIRFSPSTARGSDEAGVNGHCRGRKSRRSTALSRIPAEPSRFPAECRRGSSSHRARVRRRSRRTECTEKTEKHEEADTASERLWRVMPARQPQSTPCGVAGLVIRAEAGWYVEQIRSFLPFPSFPCIQLRAPFELLSDGARCQPGSKNAPRRVQPVSATDAVGLDRAAVPGPVRSSPDLSVPSLLCFPLP